ncbi:MAG: hypothetical protein PHR35_22365 [Kiritimatiellae bacterium]|nr:hypothetical protein [Kiritimatiellia bacterium]
MTDNPLAHHWKRTLYASAAAQFFCMIGAGVVFPFLPFYLTELGVDDPLAVRRWAGLIGAAAHASMALLAPVWGSVSDRVGGKAMVLRSMLALTAIMC